jgi:RNA recognition motif-containing protein
MTTLFVGNLPFSATEAEVRSLFEQYGRVEDVKIINDRDTGRPRGIAYVDMPASDAQDAFEHVNGIEMNGRVLRVDQARDRSPRPQRGGSGDRW